MKKYDIKNKIKKGFYLPVILMASAIFIALITAIISLSISNVKIAELHNKKIAAMAISEAGINYYLWHLSHNSNDFCDGNTCQGSAPYGPYTHNYTDKDGNSVGIFDLYITPPNADNQFVVVKSVGKVLGKSPERTIVAELGIPSFAKYTLLTNNTQLWVGNGEKINGNVHVNNSGIYNEGQITGDVSSTEESYSGWFGNQPGVAGPGTFGGAKLFPVPLIDFNQVGVDIANIQSLAQANGQYFDRSKANGYHLVLKDNSFDLYKVTKFSNSTFAIEGETAVGNFLYPASGVVFFLDNLWVEGKIYNQKVTIVAADPEAGQGNQKKIYIPNNIKYTNYDGTDKIGLITQTDILVTKDAPTDLEIDAAMIARNGEIKIDDYGQIKNRIKVYGSMAHNGGILWTYGTLGGGISSGYRNTETTIDQNNVLNPPPDFPTTGSYSVLSWREE